MPGRFALLPLAQTKMMTDTKHPSGDGRRLVIEYDLEIQVNGSPQSPRLPITAALKGPGDVMSINRAMIARVEPGRSLRGFEPNYIPFIEFVDADFPWRYSLDVGKADRKKPWLVLLALRADEYRVIEQGRGPLPRIRVNNVSRSLPDLSQSWATAHVQVNLESQSGASVQEVVQSDPGAHFSRLLCLRRLEERTAYVLFLVPAYEAGRLAGLGLDDVATPFDAPAWNSSSSDSVDLPVYFQSQFVTNTLEDLETLARRLRGLNADDSTQTGASRKASASHPGYYPNYSNPGATFEIQSALHQPDEPIEQFNTDPQLVDLLVPTLEAVIEGEIDDDDDNDPLVAFAPYGWRFAQQTSLSSVEAENNQWFERINLDLKFRQVAGLGAETVRRNQETFARKCWEQYEDILDANQRLARLQAADVLVNRISSKHFRLLKPDIALSLAEPLQPYAPIDDSTVVDFVRNRGIPSTFASRGLRRQAAKRQIKIRDGNVLATRIPSPAIPGDITSNPLAGARSGDVSSLTPRAANSIILAEGLALPVANGMSAFFDATFFAAQKRPRRGAVAVAEFESATLSHALADLLSSLPRAKADFTVGGRLAPEKTEIGPIYRSPIVPLPLSEYVEAISKEALLADASNLPDNTVAPFEENRHFIEAFMVGANHEMNNELRWQEFPLDMRGTIFRRFWDRGYSTDDVNGDDISQIHTWDGSLGSHYATDESDETANVVIVIRGDIVRKLGQPIVVLNEAPGSEWVSGAGIDHQATFFGRIGQDIAYFGFDIPYAHLSSPFVRDRTFLVIYEQMGRLRFGLDTATADVRQKRRVYENLSLGFPLKALGKTYEQVPAKLPDTGIPVTSNVPDSWNDLSWSHMELLTSGYIDVNRIIPVAGHPAYWDSDRTSASIARSFWQKPLAVVMPITRVLQNDT